MLWSLSKRSRKPDLQPARILALASAVYVTLPSLAARSAEIPAPPRRINAFCISKETNGNAVCYDARLTQDCRFLPDDPIAMEWAILDNDGGSHREGLGFFEKGLYGVDVKKSGPAAVTARVRAVRARGLDLPIRITATAAANGCQVRAFVQGTQIPRETQVLSIRLQRFRGLAPRELDVQGRDVTTNAPARYTVRLG